MRITPPAGFTLTGATAARGSYALPVTIAAGAATVDGLDLDHAGQTATVTLQARIACGVTGAANWTVVGHSTDSFSNSYATTLVAGSGQHVDGAGRRLQPRVRRAARSGCGRQGHHEPGGEPGRPGGQRPVA